MSYIASLGAKLPVLAVYVSSGAVLLLVGEAVIVLRLPLLV